MPNLRAMPLAVAVVMLWSASASATEIADYYNSCGYDLGGYAVGGGVRNGTLWIDIESSTSTPDRYIIPLRSVDYEYDGSTSYIDYVCRRPGCITRRYENPFSGMDESQESDFLIGCNGNERFTQRIVDDLRSRQ
jgi:hypothetical protein